MDQPAYQAAPNDSRYTPFTQQSYCCVPTSIQMIMYKNGIPLVPAEEIGYHLGLTVPSEEASLFYNVRVAEQPPTSAGYGTDISAPAYEPNKMFAALQIPLRFEFKPASAINNVTELVTYLKNVERTDTDALLCFNQGVIRGQYQPHTGHVVVFDAFVGGLIRIVDASPKQPKWRLVEPGLLFEAIQQHGDENSGGIWYFNVCEQTT